MNAFVNGKTVETDRKVYQFSSESRAREFLRYVYQQGEASASSKVPPVTSTLKDRTLSFPFPRNQ